MQDSEIDDQKARVLDDPHQERRFRRGFRLAWLFVALIQLFALTQIGQSSEYVSAYASVLMFGVLLLGASMILVTGVAMGMKEWGFAKGWFAGAGLGLGVTFTLCAAFARA